MIIRLRVTGTNKHGKAVKKAGNLNTPLGVFLLASDWLNWLQSVLTPAAMKPMPENQPRRTGSPVPAILVFVLAMAATTFGVWREREIARRGAIIRWQDSLAQLQPILTPLLGQRFETLHDQAKFAMRRGNASESAWQEFLSACEWRARFPGMLEIGYAEFNGDACNVKFLSSQRSTPEFAAGYDLNTNVALREFVQKAADAGYGIASHEIAIGTGTNLARVTVSFIPLTRHDMRPGSPAENRANLLGFLVFALDQHVYFETARSQFQKLPFDLRLLAGDEPLPPRTATQRSFTNGGQSGQWRMVATMKAVPAGASTAQWVVAGGGIALSLLLYFLFAMQSRLRVAAEVANQNLVARDAEIQALNRGLEEKVAERTAQLNEALAEEKELNQLKSNFISMVSHEIRTPLALILSSSEILSRYHDRLASEKRTEHLQAIDSAVQRMGALMEDVLLFSKAEAGRMEFKPVPMELTPFCEQLVDEIQSTTARRCPIELTLAGMAEPARADEALLRHILGNLLTNAVKYSMAGAAVALRVSRVEGEAVFEIEDHGIGIPDADRSRLFTPFHRGKNAAHIVGTGLGLVIVRRCVERHGGKFDITSREGKGTTATVRLPVFTPAHTEFLKRVH